MKSPAPWARRAAATPDQAGRLRRAAALRLNLAGLLDGPPMALAAIAGEAVSE